jgi:5-methylcytosine-specific restriction protein A
MPGARYPEGAVERVAMDRYERNRSARQACIAHFGATCQVCGLDFETVYGTIGQGFIEVHHLRELSTVGPGYTVDPVKDLLPVCPNCHTMLHYRRRPARSPQELKQRLALPVKGGTRGQVTR